MLHIPFTTAENMAFAFSIFTLLPFSPLKIQSKKPTASAAGFEF